MLFHLPTYIYSNMFMHILEVTIACSCNIFTWPWVLLLQALWHMAQLCCVLCHVALCIVVIHHWISLGAWSSRLYFCSRRDTWVIFLPSALNGDQQRNLASIRPISFAFTVVPPGYTNGFGLPISFTMQNENISCKSEDIFIKHKENETWTLFELLKKINSCVN